jgi:DNA (cytosine-5)-methyltransferase 1
VASPQLLDYPPRPTNPVPAQAHHLRRFVGRPATPAQITMPSEYSSCMAKTVRFIDLFCGIGGFRFAIEQACKDRGWSSRCVFSSDIDPDAQSAYEANFGERPTGDITKVAAADVPAHDILLGGFPCQAFSIIGDRKGFEDARGTLFFDIARILKERRPSAFVLENVKQLRTHSGGKTHARIMETLRTLGYHADSRVLNALDYGVAQKRERIFIVGFRDPRLFRWPKPKAAPPTLESVLESDDAVPEFYWASDAIRKSRKEQRAGRPSPKGRTIWHENKGGNVSALPYSCALRAGASYNYLLVDGKRRLTEREMLRLQGFPETFRIACGYSATRKQAGNSVAVPCVYAVVTEVLKALSNKPIKATDLVPTSLFAYT